MNNAMPASGLPPAPGTATAVDPVCRMTVQVTDATRTEGFAGQSFHFCSDTSQTTFKADPWFYASGNAARRGQTQQSGSGGGAIHLPDAPADPPRRARQLSDLRHDAGACGAD